MCLYAFRNPRPSLSPSLPPFPDRYVSIPLSQSRFLTPSCLSLSHKLSVFISLALAACLSRLCFCGVLSLSLSRSLSVCHSLSLSHTLPESLTHWGPRLMLSSASVYYSIHMYTYIYIYMWIYIYIYTYTEPICLYLYICVCMCANTYPIPDVGEKRISLHLLTIHVGVCICPNTHTHKHTHTHFGPCMCPKHTLAFRHAFIHSYPMYHPDGHRPNLHQKGCSGLMSFG